jgi:branched-chain amino acid transport system permease protein
MSQLVLQSMNGLTIAAIYILLAAGLTIVFGLQGIVNIAHGVFYMLGAYLGVTLVPLAGFGVALLATTAAGFALGAVLELFVVRPLIRWKRPGTQVLVATLAIAILASELIKIVWGPVPQLSDTPAALAGSIEILGLGYPAYWLFIIGFTVVLMGTLGYVFNKTDLGILVQSIALDREIAQAMGTNAPLINTMVFALGSAVAALAGALAGPILSVYPTMCFDLLMILFVVVILGGLGSLLGVIVGGILIGLVNAFAAAYLSGTLGNVVVFAVMIAVLLVRPLGLFGRSGILK